VDDDIALDEKRVYAGSRERTEAYVASDVGLTRVEVAGNRVGRFALARRGAIRDVAGGRGRLVAATAEDVLVGTGKEFVTTGFGPATAVGIDGDRTVAAGPRHVGELVGDEWRTVAEAPDVRAVDGTLLAAGEGYRIPDTPDGTLEPLAVDGVRDVAAAGPYVAAVDGLYRVDSGDTGTNGLSEADSADGPITVRQGAHEVVAADSERAHAVAGGRLYERRESPSGGERDDEEWAACEVPVEEPIVDVAYGESVYAVTGAGTVLVDADPEQTPGGHGGWRSRALGVAGACAVAVP